MKKTFVAAAVLGALAGSAFAADVTLYGVVDLGLNYQNTKADGESSVNSFKEQAGQNSGSRWGLKGSEDLGNGYKVGFVLENGFTADDGKLGNGGRMFGREANLYVTSDFGTLSFGRVGALTSGAGSYNLTTYTPFSTGWGELTAQKKNFWIGDRDRMDNTVTYVTPSFAGVKVYAQYSFNRDGQEDAGNERQNDRYAAIGAKYENGPFSAALVVDSVFYNYDATSDKDSLGVTLGASYDFEVVKLFAQAQYGKNEKRLGLATADGNEGSMTKDAAGHKAWSKDYVKVLSDEGWKGYGLSFGATAPVLGGTVYAQANYLDAKTVSAVKFEANTKVDANGDAVGTTSKDDIKSGEIDQVKAKNWGIALGYSYPFSKRTFAYTYASYNELKTTIKTAGESDSGKDKNTEFGFGLVHKF